MPRFEHVARPAVSDLRMVAEPTPLADATAPRSLSAPPVLVADGGQPSRVPDSPAEAPPLSAGDLRQRLAQLEAAHIELQATAAVVAHDLRTPLAQIEGFADMLVEGGHGLDTDGRRQIEVVTRAARRMSRLVVDLLELAHIDSTPIRRVPVALDRVVARLQTTPAATARKASPIEWSIGVLPSVCGDATLLGVAFEQLVNEAVRYSGSTDRPQVRIEPVGPAAADEVVIAIRASAAGSQPAAGLPQLPPQPGNLAGAPGVSGMGMAMARRIIARHGGRTWADSATGCGVGFFIALPV